MIHIPSDDARLAVLESKVERHDGEISQLWGRVSAMEICAASLPVINESLRNISTKVENLTACALKNDGQKIAYLTIREWVIVAISLATLYLNLIR